MVSRQPMALVPKKEAKKAKKGRTRSIWADDALWAEVTAAALEANYSVSEFTTTLLRTALAIHKAELAAEQKR